MFKHMHAMTVSGLLIEKPRWKKLYKYIFTKTKGEQIFFVIN